MRSDLTGRLRSFSGVVTDQDKETSTYQEIMSKVNSLVHHLQSLHYMFDKKRSDATSKGLEAAQKERQKILTEMIKTFPEAEKFPGFDEALKTYFTTSSHLIPDIYETGGTPAVLKAFLGDALWRLESQPHQDEENKRRQKAVRSLLQKYGAQQSAGGAAAAGSHS